jgi:eukaryotic-like serine/threonine-protein kinase
MVTIPDITQLRRKIQDIEIIEQLGYGGFKVAYKARINGIIEAFKIVEIPSENDENKIENLKRIFREINILGSCTSPFIVKLGQYEIRELIINDILYVVYSEELLTGNSLRTQMNEGIRPTFQDIKLLFLAMLEVIKELKAKKIIHRDIKPDNIIKTKDCKRPFILLDFGVAFIIGGSQLTNHPSLIPGTLYYIAPEMLDQGFRQNIDYRADLYTVGLTIYEYSTGINPFARQDEDGYSTLYNIKTKKPLAMASLRDDIPEAFCGLIDDLLKKRPALRPANLDLIHQRLESIK